MMTLNEGQESHNSISNHITGLYLKCFSEQYHKL